jgi:hypothetical protein
MTVAARHGPRAALARHGWDERRPRGESSRDSGLALAGQVAEAMYVQGTAIAEGTRERDSPDGPGFTTRMNQEYMGAEAACSSIAVPVLCLV